MISAKIVVILIWAACATVWELVFKNAYYGWVSAQGGVAGFGEVFIGWAAVGGIATLVSAVVIRRLKQKE